jgi:hypothetical protein
VRHVGHPRVAVSSTDVSGRREASDSADESQSQALPRLLSTCHSLRKGARTKDQRDMTPAEDGRGSECAQSLLLVFQPFITELLSCAL